MFRAILDKYTKAFNNLKDKYKKVEPIQVDPALRSQLTSRGWDDRRVDQYFNEETPMNKSDISGSTSPGVIQPKEQLPSGLVNKVEVKDNKVTRAQVIPEEQYQKEQATIPTTVPAVKQTIKPEIVESRIDDTINNKLATENPKYDRQVTDGTSNLYNFEKKPDRLFDSIIYNGKEQILDDDQLDVANYVFKYAQQKGFQWPGYALKLLFGESSYGLLGDNDQGNNPPSVDRGIYQINSHYHPEINDEDAHDIDKSIDFMIDMVNNGKQHEWIANETAKAGKIKLTSGDKVILDQS